MQRSIQAESSSIHSALRSGWAVTARTTLTLTGAWSVTLSWALSLPRTIPGRVGQFAGAIHRMRFGVFDIADGIRNAQAWVVLHIDQHVINRLGEIHAGSVANRVGFQAGGST